MISSRLLEYIALCKSIIECEFLGSVLEDFQFILEAYQACKDKKSLLKDKK